MLEVIGRELTRELPSLPSSIADGITLASATNESFYGGPTPNNSLKAQVISKSADASPCQAMRADPEFLSTSLESSQLAGFLHACSYLRVPLIFLNTLVILVKTVFG